MVLCRAGEGSMLRQCSLKGRSVACFHVGPVARSRAQSIRRSGRLLCATVRAENVLIMNTKGGGHAFIGLYLAKQLLKDGHSVTILNDGDEAKVSAKAPYNQYGALAGEGVTIAWGSPADVSAIPSGSFDVVYDNNGKDMAACQPAIDHFKGKVAHYVFVASAGAYKGNAIEPALVEGDPRKDKGHPEVERYLESQGLPFTVFQPLYLYGPYNGKDAMPYFLDRLMRGRPVPIPAPGNQITSLTHIEDLAALLAKVPGNKKAVGQQYNVCSDRYVTFDGIVKSLAAAAGVEPGMLLYDPKAVKLEKGEGFPFRTNHFFAQVEKAKRELDWQPKRKFTEDVPELVEAYKASGRLDKEPDFSFDEKVKAAVGGEAKVPVMA